jgi:hypothetical protein
MYVVNLAMGVCVCVYVGGEEEEVRYRGKEMYTYDVWGVARKNESAWAQENKRATI